MLRNITRAENWSEWSSFAYRLTRSLGQNLAENDSRRVDNTARALSRIVGGALESGWGSDNSFVSSDFQRDRARPLPIALAAELFSYCKIGEAPYLLIDLLNSSAQYLLKEDQGASA